MKNKLCDVSFDHGRLTICFKDNCRDEFWAKEYGQYQAAVEGQVFDGQKITSITYDISRVFWVDPIPALSLLMDIAKFHKIGGQVRVLLPSLTGATDGSLKLLRFLAHEGFIEELLKRRIKVEDEYGHTIGNSIFNKYLNIEQSYRVIYSPFVKITLLNLSNNINVRKSVDSILRKSVASDQNIPVWAQEDINYRIFLFLVETLQNVREHAYVNNEPNKFVGFYARYRTGGKDISQQVRRKWKTNIYHESLYCPTLRKYQDYLSLREGCLEVFVVDVGQGVVNSFKQAKEYKEQVESYGRYPFRRIISEIFKDGLTTKSEKLVPSGGLHLLHGLLSDNNDLIRGFDRNEWVGTTCPLKRKNADYRSFSSEGYVKGLAWTARFSWRSKTDFGPNWLSYNHSKQFKTVTVLSHDLNKTEVECYRQFHVHDERFKDIYSTLPDKKYVNRSIYFPKTGLMKWDIKTEFENIYKKLLKNTSTKNLGWKIIIADIPVHEAETYLAAFVEIVWKSASWLNKVEEVILVSQHLSVCVLKKTCEKVKGNFSFVNKENAKYYIDEKNKSVDPAESIISLIKFYKYIDSYRLWDEIAKNKNTTCFLPEQVAWGKDEGGNVRFLDGYLDFLQVLTIQSCFQLIYHSLKRIPGYLYGSNVELISIDQLTKNIIDRYNCSEVKPAESKIFEDDVGSRYAVFVGSVIVTGQTIRQLGKKNDEVLHFFKHPSSNQDGLNCLFYWPDNEWLKGQVVKQTTAKKNAGYVRVGKTPIVAKGGRKYFPLPRYDSYGKLVARRSPSQTYQDWQSLLPQIMRFGHFTYEAHHDLLTVNLQLAVKHSFNTFGDLALYLFHHLYNYLDVSESDLNQLGLKWLSKIEGLSKGDISGQVPIVVYPSHINTEVVIDEFLNCIEDDAKFAIRSKLIPLVPIRGSHDGSTIIFSPLVLERIKINLASSNLKNVLIFDDAVINGKTIRELKCILDASGAENIFVLTILNRNRMPQGRRHSKDFNHYWRFDVPLLGGQKICPLCRGIEIVNNFISSIASSRAQERLSKWVEYWKPISTTSSWEKGLKGIPLKQGMQKRFSIYYDEKKDDYIARDTVQLSHSLGLISYACELHTMTGQDDITLDLCRKAESNNNLLPWAARIEMFSSHLLLFSEEYEEENIDNICLQLLIAICESKRSDKWTALGCIVLQYIFNKNIDDLVEIALRTTRTQPTSVNWDAQLLFAYFLHRDLLSNTSSKFDVSKRLLSSQAANIAEKYNQLHLEKLDMLGNAHSRPISRWADGKTFYDSRDRESSIAEVRDSLDKIEDVLYSLDSIVARVSMDEGYNFNKNRRIALSLKSEIIELLNDANEEDASRNRCYDFLKVLGSILDHNLFFRLHFKDLNTERPFEKFIEEVFTNIDWEHQNKVKNVGRLSTDFPSIGISYNWSYDSKNIKERWVVMDSHIRVIIYDLLINAIYIDSKGDDPWGRMNGTHSIWMSVEYRSTSLVLSLSNKSIESSGDIFEKIEENSNWNHLYEIGGNIVNNPKISGYFCIDITLPYLGFLNQLNGVNNV